MSDESKAKGGFARANSLSPQERSEIARRAAQSRWGDPTRTAVSEGDLKIGDTTIPCAVLDDGTRVLSRSEFVKAIGRKGKVKGGRLYDDEFKTPVFLTAANLKVFIPEDLEENSKPRCGRYFAYSSEHDAMIAWDDDAERFFSLIEGRPTLK